MEDGRILEPAQLRRYADAIVKASLGVTKGEPAAERPDSAASRDVSFR